MSITIPPTVPSTIDTTSVYAEGLGLTEDAKETVADVAKLLSNYNINIIGNMTDPSQIGQPNGATGIPALDNPEDLQQIQENLEKLLAYLQLDNEERQAQMAKERIEVQKDSLESEHKTRMDKINESLKKMEDAAKSRLATRIFGYIGAALAVLAAVVTTIVTGGAAAAFAIAGAVVAVTALVMSETGATDKLIEAIADSMEKSGMSHSDAQLAASLIVNLSIMLISLGCSLGGMGAGFAGVGKAVADSIGTVARVAQGATSVASTAVGVGSLAAGAASTALNYEAEMAKADVSELEKIMMELQRRLDESEEELNALLEAIQNGLDAIAQLLASATDTQTEIASQIGQMA